MTWKQWWHTPPKATDLFFTRIRKAFQYMMPCKHKWFHPELWVHGEYHNKDMHRRRCKWCNFEQYLVYRKYGNIRLEWKNFGYRRRD